MQIESKMDNQIKPRIERGITKIIVPYLDGEIAFAYPSVGPNTYQKVGQEILKRNLSVPHGDYTASLVHAAYCDDKMKDEPEFEDIRNIMKNRWLWIFNKNLWTDTGVYVVQDTEAHGRSEPLNHKNLEKMLKDGEEIDGVIFSNDGKVRFAPKGTYKIGEHTTESFAQDGFVRATAGIVGAKKFGEVSEKFKYNPITWGVEVAEGQEQKLIVSALVDYVGGRLYLGGYYFGDDDDGHAFGVL